MRTPCECWLACRPIARRSAQLATRSWSATASDWLCRSSPKHNWFWGGGGRLWGTRQSFPARVFFHGHKHECGAADTSKKYLERLTVCSIESLTWQDTSPLVLSRQAKLAPPVSPLRRGFTIGADRAAIMGGTKRSLIDWAGSSVNDLSRHR
jgi:hypothetical protein